MLVFAFQKQFSEICECLDLNGTYKVDAEGISMYLYFRFVCAQFYYHKCYICAKQVCCSTSSKLEINWKRGHRLYCPAAGNSVVDNGESKLAGFYNLKSLILM